jgi:O-antigen/teichoic acid export membrane protein
MSTSADTPISSAASGSRGLRRRIVSGIGIQALNRIVGVGRVFIIVPFFLAAHGVDGYADWLKLLATAQLISMVTLGQNDFYNFVLRAAGAQNDYEVVNRHMNNGIMFYAFLIIIFFLFYGFLALFLDLTTILNLSYLSDREATWVLALLCLFTIGITLRVIFSGVYTAFGEFARGEAIFTLNAALLIVVLVVALLLGAPLWVLALLHVAVTPGLNAVITVVDFTRRYHPVRFRPHWPRPVWSRARMRSLTSYAVPTFVDRALESGPTVLLGVFAVPPALVVQFNLARRALFMLDANLIARIFAQEMTRQRLQEEWAGFRRLHRAGAVAVGTLGGTTLGALMAFWPFFLPLWTQNKITPDMGLFTLLLVEQTLHTYGRHPIMLLRLGGQPGVAALWASAAAVTFLALGVPALALGSIYGMTIVLVAVKAVFFYVMPPLSLQRRIPQADALASIAVPFVVGAVLALPCYLVTAFAVDLLQRLLGG